MSGIHPELVGADDEAFRVGCFEQQLSARPQDAHRFLEHLHQGREIQMLDDMHHADEADGARTPGRQPFQRIGNLDGKPHVLGILDLPGIGIDAHGVDAFLLQDFQPFAAATSNVDGRILLRIYRLEILDMGNVDAHPFQDFLAAAAITVLKLPVEHIKKRVS